MPLVYFGYNLVYAVLATPLGALSDRWGRLPVLIAGYTAFGLVYAGWAYGQPGLARLGLFLVYGIYAAATDGVSKALVTDVIPKAQRGTAMGWFNGVTGFAALPANVLGGWLWSTFGPSATFGFGAWLGFVAAAPDAGLGALAAGQARPRRAGSGPPTAGASTTRSATTMREAAMGRNASRGGVYRPCPLFRTATGVQAPRSACKSNSPQSTVAGSSPR